MLYFFDTSGLQYRYFDSKKSRGVRRIISDKRNRCFVSEMTVLEISSALGRICRREQLALTDFARMDREFWSDVHKKRLLIRPVEKAALLRARNLLRRAAESQRRLTSADAIVASSAMELAFEENEKVTLCLEDWNLYDVIRGIPAYKAPLRFKYLGEDKLAKGSKPKPPPCPTCGK
jgi:hypothetical protein